MAIFKSNVTADEVYKVIVDTIEERDIWMSKGDSNIANLKQEKLDRLVEWCYIEENAKKLGIK